MDIRVPDEGECLLCRKPCREHCGGDYDNSLCYEGLYKLARALDELSLGLIDHENYNVVVKVRKHKLVEVDVRVVRIRRCPHEKERR